MGGETRDPAPPVGATLALQAVHRAFVQPVDEGVEGVFRIWGWPGPAATEPECGAPDLAALLFIQVVEKLGEASNQVYLGEHQIDRQVRLELRIQFLHPRADGAGVGRTHAGRRARDLDGRDGNDDAVQWLAGPGSEQQVEEGRPPGPVGVGIVVLCRVAARGVDQHRLVGEPPLAVPRSAHATQMGVAGLLRDRKGQSGVQQGCRLSGSGGPDDHVPGLLVQRACATQRL